MSKHFDSEKFDWNSYMTYRPTYPQDFYERILSYHREHSNRWFVLHDVCTGPGNVAEVLSKHFDKVIASDAVEHQVEFTRKRLESLHTDKFTVLQSRAEELVEKGYAVGSADMITDAMCLLFDTKKALSEFAKVLRPGGTLAIWFYGRPIFAEEGQERSQALYQKIMSKCFDKFRPMKNTIMEPAFQHLCSWLDSIAFPPEDWEHVQRIKWNNDKPLSFLDEDDFDFEINHTSEVRSEEQVVENIDREFWAMGRDVDWVRGFVNNFMAWNMTEGESAQIEELYNELQAIMGGKKTKICWPVVLLLATKR